MRICHVYSERTSVGKDFRKKIQESIVNGCLSLCLIYPENMMHIYFRLFFHIPLSQFVYVVMIEITRDSRMELFK